MATFDGDNKLIILTIGDTTSVTVQDLYSLWKEWSLLSDNLKYLPAFSSIGGEPTVAGQFLGSTYFIRNGWKIRPYEGDHTLVITGNLFADDGSSPFVHTVGNYNVLINLNTSNIIDKVAIGGASFTVDDIASAVWDKMLALHQLDGSAGKTLSTASSGGVDYGELANAVWDEPKTTHTTGDTFGKLVQDSVVSIELLRDVQEGNWEIQGTQMVFFNRLGAEMLRYNLTDSAGAPSNVEVFKRTKI